MAASLSAPSYSSMGLLSTKDGSRQPNVFSEFIRYLVIIKGMSRLEYARLQTALDVTPIAKIHELPHASIGPIFYQPMLNSSEFDDQVYIIWHIRLIKFRNLSEWQTRLAFYGLYHDHCMFGTPSAVGRLLGALSSLSLVLFIFGSSLSAFCSASILL